MHLSFFVKFDLNELWLMTRKTTIFFIFIFNGKDELKPLNCSVFYAKKQLSQIAIHLP